MARLYRSMQEWTRLIDTYERHIQATPDRSEKIRCYKAQGEVFQSEAADIDRAVDSYLSVLSIDEDDVESLDALATLYDKRDDYSSSLDMMGQLVRLVDDPKRQVELKFRMGRNLDEHLGDRVAALDHYQTALDLEPGHLATLAAMRKIQIDSGDWLAAAKLLTQEAEYTESGRLKAERLVELGRVYQDHLDESEKAIEAFEQAYKLDEDNEDAALPLVDHYAKIDRWGDALPLLQMLVLRSGKRDQNEQHRLAFMLGESAAAVKEKDEAIKAFTKAYQLDSHHLPSLMGLARAHYEAADWEKAFKYYQMLLVHHRESLGSDETTDIFFRLGVVKREQGERRKALNMFDKALEEDSGHRPTLEAVVGMHAAQGDFEQVVHFKKRILENVLEEDGRFALLGEIGDVWREKLKNYPRAIECFAEASDIKPDNHVMLHKLLECYQLTKSWPEVIETIDRIAGLDDRVSVKAKYAYTAAVITRDELKDTEGAIERFNKALDYDPEQLKAFEAVNKILNTKKDWKALERAYRKMLHRIIGKGNAELEFSLWHTLGIIFRDRQKNFEAAAEAFKMASNLRPEDGTQHQILAELYTMLPGKVNDAIAEHQWMLQQDVNRVESYRALYKLYFDARAYDKAWCVASTLTYLKKADEEQQRFYTQYKPQGIIRPNTRGLDNERWVNDIYHPEQDLYVSKLMAVLGYAVHTARHSSDKALNLLKKKPADLSSPKGTFAQTFAHVMQVLYPQMDLRLFIEPNAPGGMAPIVGSHPPALLVGSALSQGYMPHELAFVIGRQLAYYRPEHYIRTMMSSHSELKTMLLAALHIAGLGGADEPAKQVAKQLAQFLSAEQGDALRAVARRFVEAGGSTDVKRWMQTVEISAIRAGLLVSNDLEASVKMIQALQPAGSTDLPPKEKMKELILYSISEQYFRAREALGIQIQV
ncbi:MAG: tetratricopeptide repeat protein [Polyangiaceae bacterium]|nr:tetratricopeptide repeat protein [Polyangiaceae bacterium]